METLEERVEFLEKVTSPVPIQCVRPDADALTSSLQFIQDKLRQITNEHRDISDFLYKCSVLNHILNFCHLSVHSLNLVLLNTY